MVFVTTAFSSVAAACDSTHAWHDEFSRLAGEDGTVARQVAQNKVSAVLSVIAPEVTAQTGLPIKVASKRDVKKFIRACSSNNDRFNADEFKVLLVKLLTLGAVKADTTSKQRSPLRIFMGMSASVVGGGLAAAAADRYYRLPWEGVAAASAAGLTAGAVLVGGAPARSAGHARRSLLKGSVVSAPEQPLSLEPVNDRVLLNKGLPAAVTMGTVLAASAPWGLAAGAATVLSLKVGKLLSQGKKPNAKTVTAAGIAPSKPQESAAPAVPVAPTSTTTPFAATPFASVQKSDAPEQPATPDVASKESQATTFVNQATKPAVTKQAEVAPVVSAADKEVPAAVENASAAAAVTNNVTPAVSAVVDALPPAKKASKDIPPIITLAAAMPHDEPASLAAKEDPASPSAVTDEMLADAPSGEVEDSAMGEGVGEDAEPAEAFYNRTTSMSKPRKFKPGKWLKKHLSSNSMKPPADISPKSQDQGQDQDVEPSTGSLTASKVGQWVRRSFSLPRTGSGLERAGSLRDQMV